LFCLYPTRFSVPHPVPTPQSVLLAAEPFPAAEKSGMRGKGKGLAEGLEAGRSPSPREWWGHAGLKEKGGSHRHGGPYINGTAAEGSWSPL